MLFVWKGELRLVLHYFVTDRHIRAKILLISFRGRTKPLKNHKDHLLGTSYLQKNWVDGA